MKKLVLKAGLSYSAKDLKCIKGNPFDVEDERAMELLATGRFEEILEVVIDPLSRVSAYAVAKLSKADLMKLAEEKNIDISGCKNKGDIVDQINAYLTLESMTQMDPED